MTMEASCADCNHVAHRYRCPGDTTAIFDHLGKKGETRRNLGLSTNDVGEV